MPKMKTHSGAKKRFSVTRRGKVQSRAAHRDHRLTTKSEDGKRDRRATMILCESDARIVLDNHLPYERKKRKKRGTYVAKKDRKKEEAA